GVTPREESAPESQHPHASPHTTEQGEQDVSTPKPFSQVLREGSWSDHDDSEGSDFMASIMRGAASKQDYADLAEQHYFVYVALEEACDRFATDPEFA